MCSSWMNHIEWVFLYPKNVLITLKTADAMNFLILLVKCFLSKINETLNIKAPKIECST